MYIPKINEETDIHKLHDLIEANSFGIIFSSVDGHHQATHLPFMLDRDRGEYGTLIAHFARANPQWKSLTEHDEVLVVFSGPHSYISAQWYTPPTYISTWNYAAVHAYGKPHLVHDPEQIRAMVLRLAVLQGGEKMRTGLEADFPENLLKAVVGIEIPVERLEGKLKMSQNKTEADQQGVITALRSTEDSVKHAVAQIMQTNLDNT